MRATPAVVVSNVADGTADLCLALQSASHRLRGIQPGRGGRDHLVLGLHHVRDGPDAVAYDAGFLLAVAILFVVGSALLRHARRAPASGP
jgi:hypothetical protein